MPPPEYQRSIKDLQGQLFIHVLSAAEPFITADNFHFIASLAMPLCFWGFKNIIIKFIVLLKEELKSFLH